MYDDSIAQYERYIKECAEENKRLTEKIKENDKRIERYRQYNRDMKGRETA